MVRSSLSSDGASTSWLRSSPVEQTSTSASCNDVDTKLHVRKDHINSGSPSTGFKEVWSAEERTFPNLGEVMSLNGNRDPQVHDELFSFLAKLGIYSTKAGVL
ncbi:hypothetical protein Bbelb_374600 [Branchiostoma belcheri]|nr:hypothetical protein Bbelb_374600 [Branchiostoma belcheri]